MFDTILSSGRHTRSGALRALAVAGKNRSTLLPDVSTVGETVSGFEAGGFDGIAVRKGTSPEIIERLNREINMGLADSAIRARLTELATELHEVRPAEFAGFIASETSKWLALATLKVARSPIASAVAGERMHRPHPGSIDCMTGPGGHFREPCHSGLVKLYCAAAFGVAPRAVCP
jgi:Tripartite tricarboxylate transporter family receptor